MNATGIIFSNIHDKEIKELTGIRTLASVPFGGRYRLIDFVLSNMSNCGITNVGIITKHKYQSLLEHLGGGKPWDLSRLRGGLTTIAPFGRGGSKVYTSRFEAICEAGQYLKTRTEPYVVMSDCDNVCNIDFTKVIDRHIATGAEITVVYRKKHLDGKDSKVRLTFEIGENGRVDALRKVGGQKGEVAEMTNIMVVSRDVLLHFIEHAELMGYKSFSNDVLRAGVEHGRIYGYEFTGKFFSIDSIENYYKHSMELLDKEVRDQLFRGECGNIYTRVGNNMPLWVADDAVVKHSLISDGCVIEGTVENSILFRDVRVEKGATVKNSIVFSGGRICTGSRINCVIADKNATVLNGRELSGHETHPFFVDKDKTI